MKITISIPTTGFFIRSSLILSSSLWCTLTAFDLSFTFGTFLNKVIKLMAASPIAIKNFEII